MGNIILLDELTINKIAAGEVIERPASVVKEMVENSIDAGANNICVEIRNGGISYIRITDNGKGISKDDLELAFERHATSKIRIADDLNVVKTMGFRGEALASIAAISKVELVSKQEEEETGSKIVVEGGNVQTIEDTGCAKGTTITVQNLFYNTPVRYKFLKKDYTESGYIEDVITRLALVHPEIAFKLINSGKTIIQTSGNNDAKSVIYSIYGKDIANSILEVNYKYEEIHINGVVGKPEIARSNRTNQMFFVNNRYIKDKTLMQAAEQGFKGLLPIGKYGFLILNLEMDSSMVDVNVHPAKLEVRFDDENKVFKAVYHAIKDTLLKSELVEDTSKPKQDDLGQTAQEEKPYSFSDMFRRISNSNTTKQQDYSFNQTQNQLNLEEQENGYYMQDEEEKLNYTNSIENPETRELLEKLAKMQQDLKQQVEDNPELKLNTQDLEKDQEELEKILYPEGKQNKEEIKLEETQETYQNDVENGEDILDEKNETNNIESDAENDTLDISEDNKQENIEDKQEDAIEDEVKPADILNKITEDNLEQTEESKKKFSTMYEEIFGKRKETKKEDDGVPNATFEAIEDNNISVFEKDEKLSRPYKFIGIAFSTYIILEIDKEMYILDQHAAHERILYEKVKKNFYSDDDKDSQMLLLPDIITLTHKEMDIAKDNMDVFKKAGFELEEFGENTIKLSGVPNICIDLDTKELFLETLDEINTVARTAKQEIEEKFIATVACKAAVKANMALTKEEVDSLMEQLLKLPNPFTCPHGRPTAIKMNKNEIEKKFARRK